MADTWDDGMFAYPQSLVLVPRGDDSSVVVGSHIRGSRLRAVSAAGNEEVDLLLSGTARYVVLNNMENSFDKRISWSKLYF